VLSFPLTPGDNARAAVYAHVSPERTTPIVSADQLEVDRQIEAGQARARRDPILNGANAKVVRRP
jgi:hypothetical protein